MLVLRYCCGCSYDTGSLRLLLLTHYVIVQCVIVSAVVTDSSRCCECTSLFLLYCYCGYYMLLPLFVVCWYVTALLLLRCCYYYGHVLLCLNWYCIGVVARDLRPRDCIGVVARALRPRDCIGVVARALRPRDCTGVMARALRPRELYENEYR
ncbi:hypothetical protein RND81_13G072100 [Saponaria officinalis]|uniref:Uncharacterized protein n=1 Tax=Saponaria officinalis TaxID=3572 RepID=A0AAW1GUR8_SAPOF